MPSIIPIPALTDNYIRIRSAHRNCDQAQRDRSRLAVPASIAGERAAECLCVPGNLHGSPLREVRAARGLARVASAFAAWRELTNKL
jgi:hypothetical protein